MRRLLLALPVLFGVSIVVFSMLQLVPGDPVMAMVGNEPDITAEDIERIRRDVGLDKPVVVQYVEFLGRTVRGDLGTSIFTNRSTAEELRTRLPYTLQLTVAAMVISVTLGVTLGIIAATSRNRLVDSATMVVALLGVSMPAFWLGLVLIYVFSLKLGMFPATGQSIGLNHLVLPAVTLGVATSGITARLTRSSMLEVMRQDYVITARSKGLRERSVILRHALRNAMIPVVTIIGLQFGALLAGTVVVETVFSRLGIGQLLVDAVRRKDFPIVQGTVMVVATVYVLVNLLVDVSYSFIDPRIKYR
ncbi:MAG: nickel ABC transporter permease [Dehalococcoidia bacterium]